MPSIVRFVFNEVSECSVCCPPPSWEGSNYSQNFQNLSRNYELLSHGASIRVLEIFWIFLDLFRNIYQLSLDTYWIHLKLRYSPRRLETFRYIQVHSDMFRYILICFNLMYNFLKSGLF